MAERLNTVLKMSKTVTFKYNGFSASYLIGNHPHTSEGRIPVLKNSFAKNYVTRKWVNKGKLTRSNFRNTVNGKPGILDSNTLSTELLAAFTAEVDEVVAGVEVVYNKAP